MLRSTTFLLSALLAAATAGLLHAQSQSVTPGHAADPDQPGTTVELIIDFGDGFQKRYTQLAFQPEMTVLDLLAAAEKHPHPTPVELRGKGSTAFVVSLDQVANQGADGRNWMFLVNDKLAKKSCGITRLQPGDTVLWRFDGDG